MKFGVSSKCEISPADLADLEDFKAVKLIDHLMISVGSKSKIEYVSRNCLTFKLELGSATARRSPDSYRGRREICFKEYF